MTRYTKPVLWPYIRRECNKRGLPDERKAVAKPDNGNLGNWSSPDPHIRCGNEPVDKGSNQLSRILPANLGPLTILGDGWLAHLTAGGHLEVQVYATQTVSRICFFSKVEHKRMIANFGYKNRSSIFDCSSRILGSNIVDKFSEMRLNIWKWVTDRMNL